MQNTKFEARVVEAKGVLEGTHQDGATIEWIEWVVYVGGLHSSFSNSCVVCLIFLMVHCSGRLIASHAD